MKSSEQMVKELNNNLHDLDSQLIQMRITIEKLSAENSRLKLNLEEENQRNSFLTKENLNLSSKFKY